jgi:hypothetical protein
MPAEEEKQVIDVWARSLKAGGRDGPEKILNQKMAQVLHGSIPAPRFQ